MTPKKVALCRACGRPIYSLPASFRGWFHENALLDIHHKAQGPVTPRRKRIPHYLGGL